jgi:hypothetical protein
MSRAAHRLHSLGRRGDLYLLSRKSLSSIEIRSSPASLGATYRAFTFYLGNPISSIPVFLAS